MKTVHRNFKSSNIGTGTTSILLSMYLSKMKYQWHNKIVAVIVTVIAIPQRCVKAIATTIATSKSRPNAQRKSSEAKFVGKSSVQNFIQQYYDQGSRNDALKIGEAAKIEVGAEMNNAIDAMQQQRWLFTYAEEGDSPTLVIDGINANDKNHHQVRSMNYSHSVSEVKTNQSGSKFHGNQSENSNSDHSGSSTLSYSSASNSVKCSTSWTCICDGNTGLGTISSIKVSPKGPTTNTSNSMRSSSYSYGHGHSYSEDASGSTNSIDNDKSHTRYDVFKIIKNV